MHDIILVVLAVFVMHTTTYTPPQFFQLFPFVYSYSHVSIQRDFAL